MLGVHGARLSASSAAYPHARAPPLHPLLATALETPAGGPHGRRSMHSRIVQRLLASAPGQWAARIYMLTPAGVWKGVGIGVLAVAAGLAGVAFHELTVLIS